MNNLQFYTAIEFGSVQKMLQLVCTYSVMFYILHCNFQGVIITSLVGLI